MRNCGIVGRRFRFSFSISRRLFRAIGTIFITKMGLPLPAAAAVALELPLLPLLLLARGFGLCSDRLTAGVSQ